MEPFVPEMERDKPDDGRVSALVERLEERWAERDRLREETMERIGWTGGLDT